MPIDFIAISNIAMRAKKAHFDWNVVETIMRIESLWTSSELAFYSFGSKQFFNHEPIAMSVKLSNSNNEIFELL